MKHTIVETTRPNGVRVVIEDNENGSDGVFFKVKDYYSDGSQRDCKFFGSYNSAVARFNSVVEKENAKAERIS